MKTQKTQAQKDAIKFLKSVVKKDSELLVNIHSVSTSGMSRKMSLYVIAKVKSFKYITDKAGNVKTVEKKTAQLVKLNWYLKQAGLESLDERGQIKVGGCGMDMAFALTNNLKCALFGYKDGHSNQQYKVI